MKLLTVANNKIEKSLSLGYRSFGIHLAPSILSGRNTCPNASKGCAAACLNFSGRGNFSSVQRSRIAKTQFFFGNRDEFMKRLISEIGLAIKKAEKEGFKAAFRFNLTSDIPWESIKYNGKSVMEIFPEMIAYDYSKSVARMTRFLEGEFPPNYHLTFSRSESNSEVCKAILASGGNVAAVFGGSLPKTWQGFQVVEGDSHDLRFLNRSKGRKGLVIGLTAKGSKARRDESGFVIRTRKAVQ